MAIGNFGLPFNVHDAQRRDIRPRPTKYAESDLGFPFEMSEGIRPAEYIGVYKYLPVTNKDITTEDYTVIPKGRAVSALTTEDTTVTGAIVYPASSGNIYVGHQPSELGSTARTASIDNSWFGYQDNIVDLLVMANGGTAYSGFYTADDVTATTIKSDGTLVASGGTAFTLPANAPIGVVFHDIYQDVHGKWLNYQMWPKGQHVLTDWYVEVPYVKVDDTGYSGVNPQYQNNNYSNLVSWWNVNKKFTYLTVDVNNSDVFKAGVFVTSDLIGNYKIQGGASALTQNKTVQTLGKIIAIDNRYPKSGLEDVQTYPRSGMPGTQTAGMPKFLFDFVYQNLLIGQGAAPSVEGIYNAIRSGAFGTVRIQLLVS